MEKQFLVLEQYREESSYNDFIERFYHFPKKHLNLLSSGDIEFIYYEPKNKGKGEFFGFGKIVKEPFEDKREKDHFFVEIEEYKRFLTPVPFENESGPRETSPFDNSQNSVRRINKRVLEEICLDGNIQVSFKADAHLIKVLGEQLIASEKVGILELIKNAYDAQASKCTVRIEQIPNLPHIDKELYTFPEYEGPVIVIEDDGFGMTKEIIEKGWLRPASTIKTNIKEKLRKDREKALEQGKAGIYDGLLKELKKEHKGRIPLGEKGVGRFATHKLGRYLTIKTKVSTLDYEYILKIDWNKFDNYSDNPVNLESLGVTLTRQTSSRNYGTRNSGTKIIVSGGRKGFEWNEPKMISLVQSIANLNSPYPSDKKSHAPFQISFECPQLPELKPQALIDTNSSVFSFHGIVNDNGVLDYEMNFKPPTAVPMPSFDVKDEDFNLLSSDKDHWKDDNGKLRKPSCGSFFLHLDVWYREQPWIDGPEKRDIVGYLNQFGGISIFRDGINVFPAEWGTKSDWLLLNVRKIKQTHRISYYNMIGNLEIDQVNNLDLTDKTDREGLLDNLAYEDLKHLVKTIIFNIVETHYIQVRDRHTSLTSDVVKNPVYLRDYAKQNLKIIKNISEGNYPIAEDPFELLTELGTPNERKDKLVNLERSLKNLEKSLKMIQEQKEMLTEQAGYGLAIATSIHEISKITTNFYYGLNEVLNKKDFDKKKLEELFQSSTSLKSELKRFGPLRAIRSEKQVEFTARKAIRFVKEVFQRSLKKNNIEVEIVGDEDFRIYARYGAVVQIFSNLFDNSVYWLDTLKSDKERKIIIQINESKRSVYFNDTGEGIHEAIYPYLFQPGYSMRIPPSGLGLYVCKYYMQSMKGDIYHIDYHNRERDYGGVQFLLDFKKVHEQKEG